ncbi:PD-(D/E)XK nuclease family protein [Candidatus Woesearchaeota archaeon]|nr:PD-(D/E)XK nuclease family protein [Candidatus Woesearchaeota archaeon]
MVTYSHSKLGMFQQCRYKYKLQYIDKIKVETPTTIEAFMGDLVHQTLAKLYKDLQYQHHNTKQDLLDFLDQLWNKAWTNDILVVKYNPENYRQMGKKFISEYYDHYTPFNHLKTLGIETQDFFQLDGGQYHIRIDRLACDQEGNYYVCDYKTNNKLKAQEELDENRQLAMYSLWVKQHFKDAKAVKLVWYFLAFDKEMVSERYDEQLQQLKEQTELLIREIEQCTDFPTNVTPLCDWCVYKPICPAWKHEVELEAKSPEEFKADDGVRLVDAFASLSATKKQIEEDVESIREKLIAFAAARKINVVVGTSKKVSVKQQELVTIEEKAWVEKLLKEHGLWEMFSEIDKHKLAKALKTDYLDPELARKIESAIQRRQSYRVSVVGIGRNE